ncbi:hypothetical protein [Commensalibacter communis]|uniref:hypothetical protein n=1 Tax=Commensalibacter communis TaxID=2972786 RepID=UPI00232B465F|nr:hypothetical protein [Commensalibacter communis]
MKKLLAILPLLALPIASIAADRASDATINTAIDMIVPGYCENAFMPNTNPLNAQKWYEKTKIIIQNCYEQANKNTSLLPKNNPAYEKCLIADALITQKRENLDKPLKIADTYFLNDAFQDRYANFTKDLYGQEIDESYEYMLKTYKIANFILVEHCARK